MTRKRADFRYPSDTTIYARRALVFGLVALLVLVLVIVVLVVR